MVLLVFVIAIASVTLGYQIGSNMHPDSTAMLHELRSQLREVLLSRQNWTSREILAKLSSAVNAVAGSTVHDLEKRNTRQEGSRQSKNLISNKTDISALASKHK